MSRLELWIMAWLDLADAIARLLTGCYWNSSLAMSFLAKCTKREMKRRISSERE
jgi:hypothetical protein